MKFKELKESNELNESILKLFKLLIFLNLFPFVSLRHSYSVHFFLEATLFCKLVGVGGDKLV